MCRSQQPKTILYLHKNIYIILYYITEIEHGNRGHVIDKDPECQSPLLRHNSVANVKTNFKLTTYIVHL